MLHLVILALLPLRLCLSLLLWAKCVKKKLPELGYLGVVLYKKKLKKKVGKGYSCGIVHTF